MSFGGPDRGTQSQPQAAPVTYNAQGQAQAQAPDAIDQFGRRVATGYLGQGLSDALGSSFGGPIAGILMGGDPGKVLANYGANQAVGAGLGAMGFDSAVPYAGPIVAALQGDYGGAGGSAIGMMAGNAMLPGLGGIAGGALGGMIGGGGCYITTATNVANKKMDDDAYELKTLRHFRDTFMANDPGLAELAEDYENMSPSIVEGINARKDAKQIYHHIHTKYLVPATRAVTRKENIKALHIYADMIKYLAPMAMAKSSDPQAVAELGSEAKMVVEATAE